MKFINNILITSLFTATLANVSCFATSCSSKFEFPEIEEYIKNRTFTFAAVSYWTDGQSEIVGPADMGTSWIVEDATPNISSDYSYYMATNMHVQHAHETFANYIVPSEDPEDPYHFLWGRTCSRVEYKYADETLSTNKDGIIEKSSYLNFESIGYGDSHGLQNFVYADDEEATQWYIPCIDMFIYKVDFGEPQGKILDKLNNLNEQRRKIGYINKFAIADSTDTMNKKKYIGGYPVVVNEDDPPKVGAKWTFCEMNANDIKLQPKRTKTTTGAIYPFNISERPDHDINGNPISGDNLEKFYYYSIAPGYTYEPNPLVTKENWLGGGSSGSMIIDEDYEICGINFGTVDPESESNEETRPFFEIFKTQDFDFISKWL